MIALLGALGGFFASSRARMTQQAIGDEPVAWQVLLSNGAQAPEALTVLARVPGVTTTEIVGFTRVDGFAASVAGTVQQTGAGVVVGIPPAYAQRFPGEIRPLVGASAGVSIAQQTAANLHASVGTIVEARSKSAGAVRLRVDAIVDLPHADSMFQTVGAPPGAGAQAPPDNVMLVPLASWTRAFAAGGQTQVHVRIAGGLPPDPGAAFALLQQRSRNVEARLAGAATVGDNLGARLDAARSDAAYAQLLFLFLGLPGVVLAGIAVLALVSTGAEQRRAEQGLLRLRGASSATLVRLAMWEAATVWVLGLALGVGGAAFAAGAVSAGTSLRPMAVWIVAAAIAALAAVAGAIVIPARRDARAFSVRGAQTKVPRSAVPLVLRAKLDVVLLAAGGFVYWRAVKSGYRVVLAPEGVPTISVDYLTLLAPLCFWLGGALVSWRLCLFLLRTARRWMTPPLRPLAGGTAVLTSASMARQRRIIARAAVGVALAFSFAVSTAVFNSTYSRQARVDAELTNGADVTVSTPGLDGLPASVGQAVGRVPGVSATDAMQHRFAYVGNDLQDLYGIDPRTFGSAAPLSDAYFMGTSARGALNKLQQTPDGVLVSDETVRDFQLQPGDLVRLRLQSAADHAYHVVPFRYVGIVREFPTAPRDSFLVANASWVAAHTGAAGVQDLLIRSNGDPRAVAGRIAREIPPASGIQVSDLASQIRSTLSGLVAVDLRGLTRIELSFALLLAVATTGLVLMLGLRERRRMFAVARAIGARSRALASFAVGEGAFMMLAGGILGAAGGSGIAYVLVKTLTGVFDPPPAGLSVPVPYLAVVAGASAVATGLASAWSLRGADLPALLRD